MRKGLHRGMNRCTFVDVTTTQTPVQAALAALSAVDPDDPEVAAALGRWFRGSAVALRGRAAEFDAVGNILLSVSARASVGSNANSPSSVAEAVDPVTATPGSPADRAGHQASLADDDAQVATGAAATPSADVAMQGQANATSSATGWVGVRRHIKTVDLVVETVRDAEQPLSRTEIVQRVSSRPDVQGAWKTPANAIGTAISRAISGATPRLVRRADGRFGLPDFPDEPGLMSDATEGLEAQPG